MSKLLVKKRNGDLDVFDPEKIIVAINKAFKSVSKQSQQLELEEIVENVQEVAKGYQDSGSYLSIEQIQDLVENSLINLKYHDVVKSYILYREHHQNLRATVQKFSDLLNLDYDSLVITILREVQSRYNQDTYNLNTLYHRTSSLYKDNMSDSDALGVLITASLELTSKEAPDWEYISSRFLSHKLMLQIEENTKELAQNSLYEKLRYYSKEGLYGEYMIQNYTKEEVDELESKIKPERNNLLNYSSLNLLINRYLMKTHDNKIIESPQEMFMGIAMHLAIPEKEDRVYWAQKFYEILSNLKVTMATPTMANARKPYHQLSSCFIDVPEDSLDGIYKSLDNFAKVSKSGGGMSLYFGKVRANGSDIRGFKGVAGGVVRWIKLANDTAVAVDQLGVRQGAVAVYLDAWHSDLPEFLQLKTNNGDDRSKAHDVFPGVCYPDLFWKMAKENLEQDWHMMCPHQIKKTKGYSLEDFYGKDWEDRYFECVNDPNIHKRTMSIKDIVRLVIKSVTETGTPFTFNRDHVNRSNPNKHKGMIYSSNLCTEIAQNMSPISMITNEVSFQEDETEVIVQKSKPGDFVVCNLASLVLGNINVKDNSELEEIIKTVVRALDNVIDLNYYPVPYAQSTNKKYRAIGLGTSGYHHMLAKNGIVWESNEHINFSDKLYEKINYFAIKASSDIARDKGSYTYFNGSDWDTGDYFENRNYNDENWNELKNKVHNQGLRNGYLIAVAPTGSTSIISCTTASTDPIMHKYFLEEKKGEIVPRVAPNLTDETFWLYKSAHLIEQSWSVKATAARQKHCDQSQSFNLYVTTDHSMRQILDLFIEAWEREVKTIYYVRSKSLEIEDCDSCSA